MEPRRQLPCPFCNAPQRGLVLRVHPVPRAVDIGPAGTVRVVVADTLGECQLHGLVRSAVAEWDFVKTVEIPGAPARMLRPQ